MDFQQLADVADKWCSNTPFDLIATEETERRMDFYADPGVSFYVLCPDNGCGENFVSAGRGGGGRGCDEEEDEDGTHHSAVYFPGDVLQAGHGPVTGLYTPRSLVSLLSVWRNRQH